MKEVILLLVAVVLLPGIICPPVTVKPPPPVEGDPDVKPVEEDVVCMFEDSIVQFFRGYLSVSSGCNF